MSEQLQLQLSNPDEREKKEFNSDIKKRLNEIKYLKERIKELEHEIDVLKRFIGGY